MDCLSMPAAPRLARSNPAPAPKRPCDRFCRGARKTAVRDRPWPPAKAFAADLGLESCLGGPSHDVALTGPSPCVTRERSRGPSLTAGSVVPSAQAVIRPPPTPFRHDTPFRLTTGYRVRSSRQQIAYRVGREGLPSHRRHHPNVPRHLPREVPHSCTSRIFTASMAFTVTDSARHFLFPPSGRHFNGAAGFA
jgi:hypothetical protein